MTSLIHPRGSLRRSYGASCTHPRRPCGCGLGHRIAAWDTMGYHGITSASINRPGASRTPARRNLHGLLMGCPLKEWLSAGFLGIGEKSVAIDMSAFQPVPADTGSSTGAGGNTAMASRNDDPTMVKLKVSWTKDQLKNAPDFQYYKPPARTTSGAGGSPTTGMAPRPTTPPAGR